MKKGIDVTRGLSESQDRAFEMANLCSIALDDVFRKEPRGVSRGMESTKETLTLRELGVSRYDERVVTVDGL